MADIADAKETPATEAQYFYLHLPHHLSEAGDRETLDALLLDPGWLRAKFEATRSPQALVADYEQHSHGQMQSLIGRTLRLTAGILARDERQLLPQLLGRLMACEDARAARFLDEARRLVSAPAILTQRPSLSPPGAETARLEGHADGVAVLTQLTDGRIASGSLDNTIRLWDPTTGAETARLEGGHTGFVYALTQLADGRLASASLDKTI
ncbi:MAG: hypothetical protein V3V97_00045, partial [Hyphomicrobiaceae bacterium]